MFVMVLIGVFIILPFLEKSKGGKSPKYILDEIDTQKNRELDKFFWKNLGRMICASPPDQRVELDYTTRIGGGIEVYYGFAFQMPKWDYKVAKFDETMDVSFVYQQYYQLTKSHKESLEAKIKASLAEVAKAIGDYELVKHDLRRYEEFKRCFEENDEHTLKAIFIDQVDYHAGATAQGPGRLSMAFMRQYNIMPTIVQDFMDMTSEEDLEKGRFVALPKVEKDMLRTKWRAYQRWKEMFRNEVMERYQRLKELADARKASIDEYREWVKPFIAQHKLIKTALSNPEQRKRKVTSFVHGAGLGTSSYRIVLWVWKPIRVEEPHMVPIREGKVIRPDDEWTRKELIFNKERGLIVEYPWITEDWVDEKIKEIYDENLLIENEHYYTFYRVIFENTVIRFADGTETDDIEVDLISTLMSQNVLLVKLLELKAREEELERYINRMLGLSTKTAGVVEYEKKFGRYVVKRINGKEIKKDNVFGSFEKLKNKYKKDYMLIDVTKKRENPIKRILKYYGLDFTVFKRGPYERSPTDRLWKFYAKQMGPRMTGQLIGHLKRLMRIGE